MQSEKIYCPKCRKEIDTKDNMPIFQPLRLELVEISSMETPPLPTRWAEPAGRYCCENCSFCFILEEEY